jgi:hypothetical protein
LGNRSYCLNRPYGIGASGEAGDVPPKRPLSQQAYGFPVQMMLRDPDSGNAEPISPPPAGSPVTPPTAPPHRQPTRTRTVVRSRYLMDK